MAYFIPKTWYFQSGMPYLKTKSDQQITKLMRDYIFSETGLDMAKLKAVKDEGKAGGDRVNLLVSGVEMTFNEFRELFLYSEAIKKFGYPADIDFGVSLNRSRSTFYLDIGKEFHNKIKETLGVSGKDSIVINVPLKPPIYFITSFGVVIQKNAGQSESLKKRAGFLCYTPYKDSKNTSLDQSQALVEMHFLTKLHAWQFASEFLHKTSLFEAITGDVVLKQHVTPGLDSLINLPPSVCEDCMSPLQFTALDANLAFVHMTCNCKKTFPGYLCPQSKQQRYTTSPSPSGGLMRFLRPSILIYNHPLEYFMATGGASELEYMQERRSFVNLHSTTCHLLYVDCVGTTSIRKEFFAVLEMQKDDFWNLSNLNSILSISLKPKFGSHYNRQPPNISWFGNLLSNCKLADVDLPPLGKDKLRVQASLKIMREDYVEDMIKPGLQLDCVPIPKNSQVLNFDIQTSNWIVNYMTHYRQLLSATAELIETSHLENKKVISVVVTLKNEEIRDWNPDLENSTYVGALLYVRSRFLTDQSKGVHHLPITSRVTAMDKREIEGQMEIVLHLTGFYDHSWLTIFETRNSKPENVFLKLWTEDNAIKSDDKEQAVSKDSSDDEPEYLQMTRGGLWDDFEELMYKPREFLDEYHNKYGKGPPVKLVKQIKHDSFEFVTISGDYESQFDSMRPPPRDFDMSMPNFLLTNQRNFNLTPPVPFVYNINPSSANWETTINKLQSRLNDKHMESLNKMMDNRISFTQGPPGTAKTVCAATGLIKMSLAESGTVVALCSTNAACKVMYDTLDSIIQRHEIPIKILRIMAYTKEEVEDGNGHVVYLHNLIQEKSSSWPDEVKNLFNVNKNRGSAALNSINRSILGQQIEATSTDIMLQKQILVLTVGASQDERMLNYFMILRDIGKECPLVVVDEASKLPLSSVIPILSLQSKRFWFVGDDCQLGPLINSDAAIRSGLGFSWMRLARMLPSYNDTATSLTHSYRMHPDICKLVSITVYENKLKPAPFVYERARQDSVKQFYGHVDAILPELKSNHVAWFTYEGFQEYRNGSAIRNEKEAAITCNLLKRLLASDEINPSQIMVISMYMDQVVLLKEKLLVESASNPKLKNVRVVTVDFSQGDECDIIILSSVRSNFMGRLGFLKCVERICVAISRARHYLLWVGDWDFFTRTGANHLVPAAITNAFSQLNFPLVKLE